MGYGVTQDDEKAVKWYKKAAEARECLSSIPSRRGVWQWDRAWHRVMKKRWNGITKAVQQASAKTKFTQEELKEIRNQELG